MEQDESLLDSLGKEVKQRILKFFHHERWEHLKKSKVCDKSSKRKGCMTSGVEIFKDNPNDMTPEVNRAIFDQSTQKMSLFHPQNQCNNRHNKD